MLTHGMVIFRLYLFSCWRPLFNLWSTGQWTQTSSVQAQLFIASQDMIMRLSKSMVINAFLCRYYTCCESSTTTKSTTWPSCSPLMSLEQQWTADETRKCVSHKFIHVQEAPVFLLTQIQLSVVHYWLKTVYLTRENTLLSILLTKICGCDSRL